MVAGFEERSTLSHELHFVCAALRRKHRASRSAEPRESLPHNRPMRSARLAGEITSKATRHFRKPIEEPPKAAARARSKEMPPQSRRQAWQDALNGRTPRL